ncbi:MAG: hypothetical protein NTY77_14475 [Elusimicrobia bacterium]|nr:hypothetical protein [Elusimicrobiota bacterium]
MKDQETDEKLWPRLAAAFLRAPARPSSLETEAFVSKVMARLERPAEAPWFSAGLRWLVPAMSVALAASALLIARPDQRFTPPEDVVLLAAGSRAAPQAVPPTTDELVAMVMERE